MLFILFKIIVTSIIIVIISEIAKFNENSLDSRVFRSKKMKVYDWENRFMEFKKYIGEN